MVHFTPLLFLALSLFSVSYSRNFSVDVGKVDLSYTPDHVLGVQAGDTLVFNFFPPNITVTESSFDQPCTKLAGGIDSGFQGRSPTGGAGAFVITLNQSRTIWIHCGQTHHCSSGMVFAINPQNLDQMAQFKANAARSAIVSVPPEAWPSASTVQTTTSASGFDYSHNPVASPNSASRYGPFFSLPLLLLIIVGFMGLLL